MYKKRTVTVRLAFFPFPACSKTLFHIEINDWKKRTSQKTNQNLLASYISNSFNG